MADDDLRALPIKSLELPTKTVAKIKSLGAKTVGELFALPLETFVAAGLIERELVEMAEAAHDFQIAWVTPDQVRAAVAAGATTNITAPSTKKKNEKPTATKSSRVALPSAFIDGTLRVVRRVRVHQAATIGAGERWFFEGLVDVSALEAKATADPQTTLLALLSDLEEALKQAKIKRLASSIVGSDLIVAIAASDRAKALGLIDSHREHAADGALHLEKIPEALVAIAVDGLLAFDAHDEALILSKRLLPVGGSPSEADRIWRLRLVADAHRRGDKPADGARAIEDAAFETLTAPGAEQTLVAVARLLAAANQPERAVIALRRLFALEAKRPSVVSPRAETIDDPLFSKLHALPSFRALFKGYPVFEAKLR